VQNRMRIVGVLLLAGMLLLVSALPVAWAQDGDDDARLDEFEVGLIVRVVQSRQNLDAMESYVEAAGGTYYQEISIALLGQQQSAFSQATWERYAQFMQGADTVNVSAMINATVQETIDMGPGGVQEYVVSAEARQIDGTLYVNAEYQPYRPGLPLLPVGWKMVPSPDELDVYKHLELGDLSDRALLVDDLDVMIAAATGVEFEPDTLDDGTPVDVVTITFDAEGVAYALRESPASDVAPEIAGILFDALSADSFMEMELVLGLDDTPYAFRLESQVHAMNIDAHALAPNDFPEGMTFNIVLETTRHEEYSSFNAPLTPVEVPDVQ
jgi:hypothetical protein